MNILRYELWERIPGTTNTKPYIMHYIPDKSETKSAILIIPGSGYRISPSNAPQEGERVARYMCEKGINVFVLEYRVDPDIYPMPILDGRRAMRYIRYYGDRFGIDKEKIAVLGYSAGGHLAASLSSYVDNLEYENMDIIDKEKYTPDLQILCYPVISLDKINYYTHIGSADCLLSNRYEELKDILSLEKTTVKKIPPTFIWHNFDDNSVNVTNSLRYAECLRKKGIPVEMHIFPDGKHGIGLPIEERKDYLHNRKWIELLIQWLAYNDFWEEEQ